MDYLLPDDGGSSRRPDITILSGALATNAAQLRSEDRTKSVLVDFNRMRRTVDVADISEVELMQAEPAMKAQMQRLHDALDEGVQLLVYRFFLTAIHRNSVVADRFAPTVVASPERQAAIWADFDDITDELVEITDEVASSARPLLGKHADPLAADLLWSMSWWIHARRDVRSFEPPTETSTETPTETRGALLRSLGRAPDRRDQVSHRIYEHALDAFIAANDIDIADDSQRLKNVSAWRSSRPARTESAGHHL